MDYRVIFHAVTFWDVSLEAFAETEFHGIFSGRQLHQGVKVLQHIKDNRALCGWGRIQFLKRQRICTPRCRCLAENILSSILRANLCYFLSWCFECVCAGWSCIFILTLRWMYFVCSHYLNVIGYSLRQFWLLASVWETKITQHLGGKSTGKQITVEMKYV
jgi:hypothetical protein